MATGTDDVMTRIGEGIARGQQGDAAAARAIFAEVWQLVGPDGDPFHRCAVAHSMADVQDDPAEELVWDLRALDAVGSLTDERLRTAGVAGSVDGFRPSLHLNLADVYRRLGQPDRASEHVRLGRVTLPHLPDDGYRAMISDGLERVERTL
jgi:hypothetical protein